MLEAVETGRIDAITSFARVSDTVGPDPATFVIIAQSISSILKGAVNFATTAASLALLTDTLIL
jgi:hypothetical protein